MYKLFFKRLIDLISSLVLLLLLSPLILVFTIILLFTNNGKPFFFQKRPGKNETVFTIIKFKTMTDATDEEGNLLSNEQRITPIGNFIRKTSIDELLQLINVLKGEMSLIGPRPLLIRYLPYYTKEEQLRHAIRPGITGLAQVSGRNMLEWDKKLAYDVAYVKDLSFSTDMKILFNTARKVFNSKDIVLDQTGVMLDLDELRKTI